MTATKNWNCDGDKCKTPDGPVKVYPIGGGGNLILCHACWGHENKSRYLKGRRYGRPEEWPQLNWAEAEAYPS